ncbi:tetratricopeptide (TPR) repeat protein [Bartonella fuyuanensis]|uniref:Tetratricopeptide (TPR) repeat protein n=1 Tax=Bartonella fuyuanensis TaxID=1460968 RepID=A0A840DXJ0_9HYPH|nr:tetratricopeptide repeat protein [Bartonella fuyuanensis]MBB4076242.1 tetratricopeptide (TPR) repeat protein [Bartonella fuyuanensis]
MHFFYLLRYIFFLFFIGVFCFVSSGYGKNPPSLPRDRPSPQSLLPLNDLIPNSSSPSPTLSDSSAIILEDFNTGQLSHVDRIKQRKEAEISRLLKELKFCANVSKAKKISAQLQHLWSQSGSETIDLLMSWAENAINSDNYGLALDYLDNVLALLPTHAEAWIRRAWIHIQLNDFKLAMLDLKHALELEPRNYIAFFELGVIMEATEHPKLALKAYERALDYYPQMQKLQKRIEALLDEQSPQAL